jgi:hypothetical protein
MIQNNAAPHYRRSRRVLFNKAYLYRIFVFTFFSLDTFNRKFTTQLMRKFKLFSISFSLLASILFASCTKEETLSPLEQNKIYLTGLGETPTKWLLTSLTSSATVLPLTFAQKNYSKTYSKNGSYADSDGFQGTWDMFSSSQLTVRYVNFPSGTPATQSFQIVSLSATSLIILHNNNGTPITAVYKAGN